MAGTVATNKELGWALMLQGILTLLFGIAAVFWPGLSLVTLVYLFSAFVLASGIVALIDGVMSIGKDSHWFLRTLLGFFQLGVGVYLIRHIHVTFATLILLIGFTLIISGVVGVVSSIFKGGESATGRMLNLLSSGIALVAGIVVLFQPVSSGVAFVWILGLWALIAGPMQIALAADIRKLDN